MSKKPSETLHGAVSAWNQGDTGRALRMAQRLVRRDPRNGDARHLLGVIALGRKKFVEARRQLERAVRLLPENAACHANFALALRSSGRMREALEPSARACRIDPDRVEFAINHAELLLELEDYGAASDWCRKTLRRFSDPRLRHAHGRALLRGGDPHAALEPLRQAHSQMPRNPEVMVDFGLAHHVTEAPEEAVRLHYKALSVAPAHAAAWHNLIHVLDADDGLVEEELRSHLQNDQNNASAWAALAVLAERRGRAAEAGDAATRALQIEPAQADARLVEVRMLRRAGHPERALEQITTLEGENGKLPAGVLEHERGLILEALNHREAEAWEAFRAANQAVIDEHVYRPDPDRFVADRVAVAESFTRDWIDSWTALPSNGAGMPSIFLGGFPRSGTTLVGSMLNNHGSVCDVEEKPVLGSVVARMRQMPRGYPGSLADLDEDSRRELRQFYWQQLQQFGPADDEVRLVDRNPICPVDAGLIYRLFPEACIVFVVRDPVDVCLSCFRTNFRLNAMTAQFTGLERTAWFYDRCMRAWERYRAHLPLNVHMLRYEDLVSDPEPVMRSLLEFLGLDWNDAVVDNVAGAVTRAGRVRTASAHQVVDPLHQQAVERWRRYADFLAPVMDVLQPWRRHFGYEPA